MDKFLVSTSGELQREISAYCVTNGALVFRDPENRYSPYIAPIALCPNRFPKAALDEAYEIGHIFNELLDELTVNPKWLTEVLSTVIADDDFTRHLVEICDRLYPKKNDFENEIRLHITRNDYMIDDKEHGPRFCDTLLQVELNTVSASFAGIAQVVSGLHRHMAAFTNEDCSNIDEWLPQNYPAKKIGEAMAGAHAAYKELFSCKEARILMVVQPNERNEVDQRLIEQALADLSVYTIRRTFEELVAAEEAKILEATPTGALRLYLAHLDAWQEISVVYFRSGYAPKDFVNEDCWRIREVLEGTRAVMVPSIPSQLAGCKKIQASWCSTNVLKKFVKSTPKQKLLQKAFAPQIQLPGTSEWDLGHIANAIEHPERYVMKPQREGGGNNIHKEALKAALVKNEGLSQYILMEKIRPKIDPFILFDRPALIVAPAEGTPFKAVIKEGVSELGIFQTYLVVKDQRSSVISGHLLRTKDATNDEGGVATGYAVVNSPLLY
eukprot:Platyproteum_vivax@DN5378_c0_g1_i1.p1